ncbi:hypothetical protein RCL1_008824 [Eukaryota sp. TZLM3-RCL]
MLSKKKLYQPPLFPPNKRVPVVEPEYDEICVSEEDDVPPTPVSSTSLPFSQATLTGPPTSNLSPYSSTSKQNQSSKSKAKTSEVHHFFSNPAEDGSICCLLCKDKGVTMLYKGSVNTDTMERHLDREHRNWKSLMNQPLYPHAKAPPPLSLPLTPEQQEEFERLLIEFIIDERQSLSIVDSKSCKRLLLFLNNTLTLHCRNTIRARLLKLFESKKQQIAEYLQSLDNKCYSLLGFSPIFKKVLSPSCLYLPNGNNNYWLF